MKSLVFDQYVGKKVLIAQTRELYRGFEFVQSEVSPEDTVIPQLIKEANEVGLGVRLWLPGDGMGTAEVDGSRLNVHVQEQEDGSFEITSTNLG